MTTKEKVVQTTDTVSLDLPKAPKQIDSANTYDLDLEFVLERIIDNTNLDPAFGYIEYWISYTRWNEDGRQINSECEPTYFPRPNR